MKKALLVFAAVVVVVGVALVVRNLIGDSRTRAYLDGLEPLAQLLREMDVESTDTVVLHEQVRTMESLASALNKPHPSNALNDRIAADGRELVANLVHRVRALESSQSSLAATPSLPQPATNDVRGQYERIAREAEHASRRIAKDVDRDLLAITKHDIAIWLSDYDFAQSKYGR